MIETLRIYIAQRFPALMFFWLALFLFFYTVPFHALNPFSLFNVFKILFMLWSMRLYDDVMQWENDQEFEDRIYTQETSRSKLILPLVLSLTLSVVLCVNDSLDYNMAAIWLYFIVVNHLLYKALVHKPFWSFLLPLLKYPVLYFYISFSYVISEELTFNDSSSALALLLSFVVYDLIDNREEGSFSILIYGLVALSVALMLIPNMNVVTFISGVIIMIIALVLVILNFNRQIVPMVWLVLILLFKLIVNNYVI